MSLQLPAWLVQYYGLEDTLFTKSHPHLCLMCDLFFQQAKRVYFNFNYNANAKNGIAPVASAKVLAARDDQGRGAHPHWQSLTKLNEAVEWGCHVCRLFFSQLTETERKRLFNLDKEAPLIFAVRLALNKYPHDPSSAVQYRVSLICIACSASPKTSPSTVDSVFHDLVMSSTQDESCVREAWLERDRWSSAVQTASNWIQDCETGHPHCNDSVLKASDWPSRLIAVGNADSEVKLCKTLEPQPRYLTLSHCWGSSGLAFKLTSKTLASFCEHLPVEKLPLTFQNAIHFTRKIGVKYLWIDALCIVQDSEDDWNRQSVIMGDIYGNGVCNLAACTGSDGTTGLFPPNDTWFNHYCIVRAGSASCLEGYFKIRNATTLCDSENRSVREESITSRAWCVQELKLSRCILYFARHQLVWDCGTLSAREQEPRLLMDEFNFEFPGNRRDIQLTFQDYREKCTERGVEPNAAMIFHEWMSIIGQYTCCNLTRHTDRLVAISGLAKKMHMALGPNEEYVAGLWKRYLHLHLLWNISGFRTNFRHKHYRAPTWSWASAEGGVYNHRTGYEGIANNIPLVRAKADVRYTIPSAPYGAIRSAVLHIEGPVIKVTMSSRQALNDQILYPAYDATFGNCLKFSAGSPNFMVNLDFFFPSADSIDAHCLLVIQNQSQGCEPHVAGLIISRQDGMRGRYIRIGLAFLLPIEVLQEARSQRLVDPNEYEAVFDNGDYKISIV